MASTPAQPPIPRPRLDDKLELKPKQVHRAPTWIDRTGQGATDPFARNLLDIRSRIEQGLELPAKYYRNGIGQTTDDLLQHTGVKHLHLGTIKSDVLLFLVEFDDFVVLLEIADHRTNFYNVPVGATLNKHHLASLQGQLPGLAAQAAAAIKKGARLGRIKKAGKEAGPKKTS